MGTKWQGTARETRALDAFIKLTRSVLSVESYLYRRLAEYSLTPSQFGVLETLYHLGPLCQREIAEKLLVSGGNVTHVVDNLEKQGWVVRQRDEIDRRLVNVSLTDLGRELITGVLPAHVAAITDMMGVLDADEQEALAALCKKLGLNVPSE